MPIRRALDYPYDIPTTSYVIEDGCVQEWSARIELAERTPVLACGSNQSPTQIRRKFPKGVIPVMAGWLEDYDSVYSAHFTTYGSVAATYHHEVGLRSRQMVTWLTHEQLELMHDTEALGVNYEYVALSDLSFRSDCEQSVRSAYTYQSLRGPLKINGQPIGLQSIHCDNRPYVSLSEEGLQRKLMRLLSRHIDLDDFIQETIGQGNVRTKRTECLVQMSAQKI